MSRNRRINWPKIAANTGVTFFSVLGSTLTVDTLSGHKIPLDLLVISALMCAGIQAGLTLCREVAKAADKCEPPEGEGKSPESRIQNPESRSEGSDRGGRQRCGRVEMVLNMLTLF